MAVITKQDRAGSDFTYTREELLAARATPKQVGCSHEPLEHQWPTPKHRRSLPVGPLVKYLERRYGRTILPPNKSLEIQPGVFTRWEIAEAIGVHPTTVGYWLDGRRDITMKQADQIAVGFGVNPGEIWGDAWWQLPDVAPYR